MGDFSDPLGRNRIRGLLAVVLILVVYGSLYPFVFSDRHNPVLAWVTASGLDGVRDTAINLGLYWPVGFLLARASLFRSRILASTLVILAVAAAMECVQAFDRGRVSSLPDLLLNGLGGGLGAWMASCRPTRVSAPLYVVLVALIARTYPFFPTLHPHWAPFHMEQLLFVMVDWLAIRCALAVLLQRDDVTRELALLQLTIPAGVFILDQSASWADVAGALVALGIGHAASGSVYVRPRRLAPIMLLTVVAREVMPLHFNATPQAFHWIPFETFLSGPGTAAVTFLSKLSLYSATLWLLDPETRWIWRYGFAVTGVVTLLEGLQRYLPGRTPDISEALLVLIAACTLYALRPRAVPADAGLLRRRPSAQRIVTS